MAFQTHQKHLGCAPNGSRSEMGMPEAPTTAGERYLTRSVISAFFLLFDVWRADSINYSPPGSDLGDRESGAKFSPEKKLAAFLPPR